MKDWEQENRLVEARGLVKSYGKTLAVDHVSFQVQRGEILGILGPNGAGKTTTLHMLLGLLLPTFGEIVVFGRSPFKERTAISRYVNFSSAYGNLPFNLTVTENLYTFSRLYSVPHFRKKTAELLDQFEMIHLKDRLTGALSSGERSKLNLIKSLLNDPLLLILDEPTANLDPDMADKVRKMLKKIQRERRIGMVYTSHNMEEVEALCDNVLFINHGKPIAEGSPQQIREAFSSHSLAQVFIKIARSGDMIASEEP